MGEYSNVTLTVVPGQRCQREFAGAHDRVAAAVEAEPVVDSLEPAVHIAVVVVAAAVAVAAVFAAAAAAVLAAAAAAVAVLAAVELAAVAALADIALGLGHGTEPVVPAGTAGTAD